MNTRKQTIVEVAIFFTLVWAGVALRWHFAYLPNFAPVAAVALFAGYFFRSALVGIAVPILVMLISDLKLGGYHPGLMACVYTMLALPVAARGFLRRRLSVSDTGWRRTLAAMAGLIGCAAVASLAFFLVTNFATWAMGGLYEPTAAGLVRCYVQALPFLRYTMAGDMVFATILFGGYALATSLATTSDSQRTPVSESAA
jgi:hypothetical protein